MRICFGKGLLALIFLFAGLLKGQTNADTVIVNPAQDPTKKNKVEIISTDLLQSEFKNAHMVRMLIGHVHLRQDTTDFLCDSSYQYTDSNFFQAFGNVRIRMSDSLTILSDRLDYDGNLKIAELFGNVRVIKGKNTSLHTPKLTYYRELNKGTYLEGGTIYNQKNKLSSRTGHYFPNENYVYFKDEVKLVNPEYTLTTDTLAYDTKAEVASFITATDIVDTNKNRIYAEGGFFDTRLGLSLLYKNAWVQDKNYRMRADTIYYDDKSDFGVAKIGIHVEKLDSTLELFGEYGEFRKDANISLVTDHPYAIQRNKDDTLYLFADTLRAYDDSVKIQKDSTQKHQILQAWNHVEFFMNQVQGKADSLIYNLSDSVLYMFRQPVLWSKETQLSGDTIVLWMKNRKADSLSVMRNGFIITQEDTVGYNQVKGKYLRAKFDGDSLRMMWVLGFAESIYFLKENDTYSGMNLTKCNDMIIEFLENKPSTIHFYGEPSGSYSPMELTKGIDRLEGFNWRISEKPVKPEWLIRGEERPFEKIQEPEEKPRKDG